MRSLRIQVTLLGWLTLRPYVGSSAQQPAVLKIFMDEGRVPGVNQGPLVRNWRTFQRITDGEETKVFVKSQIAQKLATSSSPRVRVPEAAMISEKSTTSCPKSFSNLHLVINLTSVKAYSKLRSQPDSV